MKKEIREKIILCDFFDTVVHRKKHPDVITQIWAGRLVKRLDLSIRPLVLYKIRRTSEKIVVQKDSDFEVQMVFSYVYKILVNSGCIKETIITKPFFLKEALQCEIDVEIENQYIDLSFVEYLKCMKKAEKKIVIVSDFYMGASVLKCFLQSHGIEDLFDDIYVSCDCKKSKGQGEIYPYVLKKLNANYDECIMIGDSRHSDYYMPLRYKIKSYLRKYNQYEKPVTLSEIKKKLNKIYYQSNDYFDFYAFPLYIFVSQLYRELTENKISSVFFCAREGKILKELFDIYCENRHETINTNYLYVSRKSTYVASLNELSKEHFVELKNNTGTDCSLCTFLENLLFTKEEIKEMFIDEDITESQINAVIEDFYNSDMYLELINNSAFANKYEEKRTGQKELFVQYLKSFGDKITSEGITLVDIGWKGTIQDNIFNILDGRVSIKGFYLGLNDLTNPNKRNLKKGLLFSVFPVESDFFDIFSANHLIYERILNASHPSTLSYQNQEGIITPVFDQFEYDDKAVGVLNEIQLNIVSKFKSIDDLYLDSVYMPIDHLQDYVTLALYNLKRASITVIKRYQILQDEHIANFGSLLRVKDRKIALGSKLGKYKRYLKKTVALFDIKYFHQVCLQLVRLRLYFLIPVYRHLSYLYNKRR